METEKYIKPKIEIIGMEPEGAIMGVSDGNNDYNLNEDGNYSGPAGAPKRKSFWGNED